MAAKPIPDGYHTVTPYLVVEDAAAAIEFYRSAFGAVELYRMEAPGGGVAHAEIKIGDSPVMVADEVPPMGYVGPSHLGGTPVSLLIYVEDADQVFEAAVAAGGKSVKPVENQFYGDRSGTLSDPWGHVWTVATHVEDVSPEELQRRFEKMMEEGGG